MPFIGDGDLALEHYSHARIFGADLDQNRVATANKRLPGQSIIQADCDSWPFPDCDAVFDVADFDAYCHPYRALRSFWDGAKKADEIVLFFTDGNPLSLKRDGHGEKPSGEILKFGQGGTSKEMRHAYNFWPRKFARAGVEEIIRPYQVERFSMYLRYSILYWGIVASHD